MVELLLQHGANATALDKVQCGITSPFSSMPTTSFQLGWQPLQLAVMFSQPTSGPTIVAQLLKHTTMPNLADSTGVTLLHTAAAKNDQAVCMLLLQSRADPAASDKVSYSDL